MSWIPRGSATFGPCPQFKPPIQHSTLKYLSFYHVCTCSQCFPLEEELIPTCTFRHPSNHRWDDHQYCTIRYFDQVTLETVILLKYCQYMRERTANITIYNKEVPPNPGYFFVIFAIFSNIYLRKSLDYTNLVLIYPQIYRFI